MNLVSVCDLFLTLCAVLYAQSAVVMKDGSIENVSKYGSQPVDLPKASVNLGLVY